MCSVDPSNEPNRPQISSVISNVKEHSREQNRQMRLSLKARPPAHTLDFLVHPGASRPPERPA